MRSQFTISSLLIWRNPYEDRKLFLSTNIWKEMGELTSHINHDLLNLNKHKDIKDQLTEHLCIF